MSKKTFQIAFIIYITVLLYLTIFSRPIQIIYYDLHNTEHIERIVWLYTHVPNWQPFNSITMYSHLASYDYGEFLVNIIGNIIAFIPFTFLGNFIFKRKYTSLILAFTTTWLIELSQLVLLCGSFDIDDIILNFTGAIIGYLLFYCLRYIKRKTQLILQTN